MAENLAPVVLFVYNRPWHTEQTLRALEKNELAKETILYIYADGPKSDADEVTKTRIANVRKIIREAWKFKSIQIIENEDNQGLANSVIRGVTEVINKYKKIIVLEDDLVTVEGFLNYMNKALELYADDKKVMQISGYQFPINFPADVPETFFLPFTTSWGWATWKRAWDLFDPLAKGWEKLKTNKKLRYRFELYGAYPYAEMLETQMEKKTIDSWAIRWWWAVFSQNGLILYKKYSLINNIGFGENSTHTKIDFQKFKHKNLNQQQSLNIKCKTKTDKKVNKIISLYLKPLQKNNHSINKKMRSLIRKFISNLIFKAIDENIINLIQKELEAIKIVTNESKVLKYSTARFYSESRVFNFQDKKEAIQIAENTHIRGELLVFGYGGIIKIGSNSYIGEATRIWSASSISIGNDVLISHGCNIIDTDSHEIDFKERATGFNNMIKYGHTLVKPNVKNAPIIIEDNVWLSYNVSILKGVCIGKGSIIGGGSVVTENVPPFSLYAGNPAKLIKSLK